MSHAPSRCGAQGVGACMKNSRGPCRKNEAECDDVINIEIRLCALQILVVEWIPTGELIRPSISECLTQIGHRRPTGVLTQHYLLGLLYMLCNLHKKALIRAIHLEKFPWHIVFFISGYHLTSYTFFL